MVPTRGPAHPPPREVLDVLRGDRRAQRPRRRARHARGELDAALRGAGRAALGVHHRGAPGGRCDTSIYSAPLNGAPLHRAHH